MDKTSKEEMTKVKKGYGAAMYLESRIEFHSRISSVRIARFQLSYAGLRSASMTQLAVTRRNFELSTGDRGRGFSYFGFGF